MLLALVTLLALGLAWASPLLATPTAEAALFLVFFWRLWLFLPELAEVR